MKALIVTLSLLTATAHADTKDERFVCGGLMGSPEKISLQVAGPRYADLVDIELEPKEIEPLLLEQDRHADVLTASVGGFIQMGSCIRGAGSLLAECTMKEDAWGSLLYSISRREPLAPGFEQNVSIQRRAPIDQFTVKVVRVGSNAHLQLVLRTATAENKNAVVKVDRILSKLDECRFKSAF